MIRKNYVNYTNLLLFVSALLLMLSGTLFGLDHKVVYTEGYPYMRDKGGDESDLEIGSKVGTGDTVVTESGDFVELEASGYKVKVSENTVFSILELEQGGKKNDVLNCALGKLSFTKDKFLGTEPKLKTSNAICGVRGTNVALLAGVDGSSLIIVEEGAIEVEAAGESVALNVGEGVEVETGKAPGAKFKAMEREIDFSKWNQGRLDTLLKDPDATAQKVKTQMENFIAEIKKIHPIYLDTMKSVAEQQAKVNEITEKQGKDEAKKYGRENLAPLMIEATNLYLNIRFYALSSLSLRRFISGRMYTILKAKYILNRTDSIYISFLKVHKEILDLFEEGVVSQFIVQADI